MVVGVKVTRHGARVTGAKTLTRGADVAESWCRDLWRHSNWRQAWRHRSRRHDPVLSTQIYREMDMLDFVKSWYLLRFRHMQIG
jgi:hypothetical protein